MKSIDAVKFEMLLSIRRRVMELPMKRPRIWSYAAIACVIAVVAVLARRTEQRVSGRTTVASAGETRNAQPEPVRRFEGRRSDAKVGAPGQSRAGNPPTPTLGEGGTAPQRMPREILDECFRAEKRDEVWAPAIEARLRAFIARQAYGNTFRIQSVECRATLCEIHASTETPVETADPQGTMSPASWQSLVRDLRQDGQLAPEFETDGILPEARYGEHAAYTVTLVRTSSAAAHAEARCGGNDVEVLRSRALKLVAAQKPPLVSLEVLGSPFKLAAYFDAEPRDEAWAAAMEASIRDALAAQPATRGWQTPAIECRTTLCQIRASTDPAAAGDFKKAIASITGESSNLGMTGLLNGTVKDPQDPTQVVNTATLLRTR